MSSPMTNENRSNKTTEEVTTALLKKRSRRVSFAENTSVLIFDRDESGSSPDPAPSNSSNEKDDSGSRQFFRTEDEDDDNDDDPDELGPPSPFIRVVASPSSGGSTIPSATSNDDDNFFGPVSSSFIRRDLSDSSSSDENHDQTMDSTAFSMHYRSIARSEAGELKTSTGINLSFEEKTPTPRSIDSNTSAMILTLTDKRKPNSIPNVSTSKMSPGSQINDMSLVGKYSNKYDYGKVSPPMNALLAEDDCDLHAASHVSLLKSPIKAGKKILADKENGPDLMDLSHDEDTKIEGIINHEELTEVVSANHIEMGLADDGSKLFTSKQPVLGVFPNTSDTQASKSLSPNQSTKATLTETNSSLELLATSQSTPSKYGNIAYRLDDVMEKENKLPLIGAIAHSTDRPSAAATPLNRTMVFQRTDSLQHVGSVSSLQKSISKLRSLEASPFSAGLTTLTTKLKNSNFKSLVSKMTPLGTLLENNIVSPQVNSMDRGEIEIMDICLENPLPNMVANKNQIPKNDVCTTL
ncbi:uncharacterized protein [Rutidosis leptorrhynchoides]|uniref:uncharacterized protein n=1 Tax=Rutidosis leptorrhynchoides TaxID=125765 RepID=UPI003A98FBD1